MLLLQGVEQLVQIARHHRFQPVQRQVDAVVGHASLREVVGADALGAVAAADLQAARGGLRRGLLLLLRRQQPGLQQGHRPRTVLVLRALVLAFDHQA